MGKIRAISLILMLGLGLSLLAACGAGSSTVQAQASTQPSGTYVLETTGNGSTGLGSITLSNGVLTGTLTDYGQGGTCLSNLTGSYNVSSTSGAVAGTITVTSTITSGGTNGSCTGGTQQGVVLADQAGTTVAFELANGSSAAFAVK